MANMGDRENEVAVIENLPNELFRKIFYYVTGVDAVFAFSLLNTRFQWLLKKYCQKFDFKSISKIKFDIIFTQYDKQWWKSLKLSNEYIPEQIEYFFQFYSLIDDVSQLKSLSLIKIESIDQDNLLSQISFLTNLVSLTLKPICGQMMSGIDLPNLKRLVVTSCKNTEWIQNFSQIEILEYEMTNCCFNKTNFIWPRELRYLKIVFGNDEDGILIPQSLEHLFQLISLEIYQKELGSLMPNGQIWEQLILSSFPLLKRFKYYFPVYYDFISINEVEKMILSFSTPFYINQKKWFTRCDIITNYEKAIIYSLPFAFDQFTLFTDSFDTRNLTISNKKINDLSKNMYGNIKTLIVEPLSQYYMDRELSTKFNENFYERFSLDLIRNDYYNSVERLYLMPNFHYRRSEDNIKISSQHFCNLLEKMPNLYSLNMFIIDLQLLTNNLTNSQICNHLSKKIRLLKLHTEIVRKQYFDENDLDQIIRVFAAKCQHLSIHMPSSVDIVGSFLRDMQQLHSLYVIIQIKNDTKITRKWLEQQQIGLNYSACFIFNREENYYFWLSRY